MTRSQGKVGSHLVNSTLQLIITTVVRVAEVEGWREWESESINYDERKRSLYNNDIHIHISYVHTYTYINSIF